MLMFSSIKFSSHCLDIYPIWRELLVHVRTKLGASRPRHWLRLDRHLVTALPDQGQARAKARDMFIRFLFLGEEKPFLKGQRSTSVITRETPPLPPRLLHYRGPRMFKTVWKWSQMTLGWIPDRPTKCYKSVQNNVQLHFKHNLWLSSELPQVTSKTPKGHQTMSKFWPNRLKVCMNSP